MRKLVLGLAIFAAAIPATATTRFISQYGGAADCGADGTQTTISVATLNATTLLPDDIVNLCGTITGSAGANIISLVGNGSSGHPITIRFESGAIVQSPVCAPDGGGTGTGGCIDIHGHSFITIEGNNTGQATQGTLSGGGIIQNTDNGDSLGHHCGTSGSPMSDCLSTLIDAFGCHDCAIQNLQMLNTYVKVFNNTSTGVSGDQQHSSTHSGSNITITNNVISNCGWCIFDNYTNGDTNVQVFNNDLSAFGHGMMYATSNASAASVSPALLFYGNHVHDPNNWTTAGCNFHNDGIHFFGLLAGTNMDGLYLHDNYFNGTWGHCATGFIYIENGSSNPSHAKTWAVWNNVGDATTESSWENTNGWLGLFSGESGTQVVFNNTLLGAGVTNNNSLAISMQNLSALTFENNTINGFQDPVWITPGANTTANNNAYGSAATCANGGNCFVWNGSFTGSFANWKSACSCDAAGIQQTNLLLNSDGSPQTGSPVIGLGLNLSAQATGQLSALQNDTSLGNTRMPVARPGGSTAWDGGGFQLAEAGGSPVTLVQVTKGAGPTSASTVTLSFTSNNTAGNKITVAVIWTQSTGHSAVTISSCSDSKSNTYTVKSSSLATQLTATHFASMNVEVCTADAIAAGANTVSVNFSAAADGCQMAIYETTPGSDDQFGPATGNSATPTSASVATRGTGDFAIAIGLLDNGFGFGSGWFTAGAGWNLDFEKGGGNSNAYTESRTQSSPGVLQGTINSNFSGTTGAWAATIYTIKP